MQIILELNYYEELFLAQINCDSPGCGRADTFDHLLAMTEAEDYVYEIIKGVANITPVCERPHRAGDYSLTEASELVALC